jgi:hypothetical protein
MVEIESRKAALIAEIEVSRGEMRRAVRRCEANLDPGVLVRKSIRKSPTQWLSGAVFVGLALSQFVRPDRRAALAGPLASAGKDPSPSADFIKREKRSSTSGWLLATGRVALDLLKPLIADWVTDRLPHLAKNKVSAAVTNLSTTVAVKRPTQKSSSS